MKLKFDLKIKTHYNNTEESDPTWPKEAIVGTIELPDDELRRIIREELKSQYSTYRVTYSGDVAYLI